MDSAGRRAQLPPPAVRERLDERVPHLGDVLADVEGRVVGDPILQAVGEVPGIGTGHHAGDVVRGVVDVHPGSVQFADRARELAVLAAEVAGADRLERSLVRRFGDLAERHVAGRERCGERGVVDWRGKLATGVLRLLQLLEDPGFGQAETGENLGHDGHAVVRAGRALAGHPEKYQSRLRAAIGRDVYLVQRPVLHETSLAYGGTGLGTCAFNEAKVRELCAKARTAGSAALLPIFANSTAPSSPRAHRRGW